MNPVPFPRGKIASHEPAENQPLVPESEPGIEPQAAEPRSVEHLRSRMVEVNAMHFERERVLPPGAGGTYGAPYKLLRTQVLQRLAKLGANSLAVVGASAETGKTLTAINLAIAIAADPERHALLVDLDLRKPRIHRRLGFEPVAGVDDCLRGERPLADALVTLSGYPRLAVLPARQATESSSELLSTRRSEELMLEMRKRYRDRILIFDLPPVLEADDALAFTRLVEAVLVVVTEGRTQRDHLVRTLELLHDAPVVGTVLNQTREAVDVYYGVGIS